MAKVGDYTISDIYQGGFSGLKPPKDYLSHGYIPAGDFGMTTDPRNANVLKEVSDKLNMGVKSMEVEGVSERVFDAIPNQQLKELNRLSKLTGIDLSLHGPVIDVAGFTRQGFNESEREIAETKVLNTLLRARDLNPDGNIPVNFHTSEGIPGSQPLPPGEREKADSSYKKLMVVNKDSGQMTQLEPEKKYYPQMVEYKPEIKKGIREKSIKEEDVKGKKEFYEPVLLEKGKIYTPEKRIEVLNESEWDNSVSQLFFNQERAKEILDKNKEKISYLYESGTMKKISEGKLPLNQLSPSQKDAWNRVVAARNYLDDLHKQANNLFSKAYEHGSQAQKKELEKISNNFKNQIEKDKLNVDHEAEAMDILIKELGKESLAPKVWEPLETFAAEKTADTFGNAAYQAYKKFKGKNVPIVTIENPPATHALSTGEDVANVVRKSREKFVKNAMSEGMDKKKAEKEAEKLIGATWDVGHINMLRRYGYKEKDIIKESEAVAPYIKHVHLSDNFGMEHTELPMGMGNVPMKKIMEKLGQKGFEAKKIIEAGDWWQHFRSPPFQQVLEATGSPIYGMKMAPHWNQTDYLQESYFGGYGQMLPQGNYQMFGAGFSQLPQELGGQQQGAQGSRMSGRPMQ